MISKSNVDTLTGWLSNSSKLLLNEPIKCVDAEPLKDVTLQTHHVYSTLKGRGNGRFHVVSTWSTRGVFVGKRSYKYIMKTVLDLHRNRFIDPFHATFIFLYSLKISENLRLTDVFRGYRKKTLLWIGLAILNISVAII